MNERMAGLSRNSVDFYGARYKPSQVVSTTGGASTASSRTNDRMYQEMKTQNKLLSKMLDVLVFDIEVLTPLYKLVILCLALSSNLLKLFFTPI